MVARQLMHLRQVELAAFMRDDGLWDLEVSLSDRKSQVFAGGARDHPAGTPIHNLTFVLTMDTQGCVTAATADMKAVPFDGSCQAAADDYALLVGLNFLTDFGRASGRGLGQGRDAVTCRIWR